MAAPIVYIHWKIEPFRLVIIQCVHTQTFNFQKTKDQNDSDKGAMRSFSFLNNVTKPEDFYHNVHSIDLFYSTS